MKKRIAVYPGTFDPVTNGHIDLVRRGAKLFDGVVVAVADNLRKKPLFSVTTRVDLIKEATSDLECVTVKPFFNLLVDFAREEGAAVIVKGLRAVSDFDYELQLSLTNRRLAPDIESVFMMPSEEYSFISSTMIKEISSMGGDVSSMVPDVVAKELSIRNKKTRGDR